MKFLRIFVNFFLWGAVVYSPGLYAQNHDFSTHHGNPLVDMGQAKITFEFEVDGEDQSFEVLKSCAYYKMKTESDEDYIYGIFLAPNSNVDFMSDEGWGVRLALAEGFGCPPSSENWIADWNVILSGINLEGEDGEVDENGFVVRGKSTSGDVIKEVGTNNVMALYIDNVSKPTFLENHHSRHHSYYSFFQKISKANVFKANKATFEYVSSLVDDGIYLGNLKAFDAFDGRISKNWNFTVYRGIGLAREDWSQNSKLKTLLDKIKKPVIINPDVNPKFLPLYSGIKSYEMFPRERNELGLKHKYVWTSIYMKMTEDRLWDVRQISFSEIWNELKRSDRKNSNVAEGSLFKIKAGKVEIDLMEYEQFVAGDEAKRRPFVWFFDPATGLLIKFSNSDYR